MELPESVSKALESGRSALESGQSALETAQKVRQAKELASQLASQATGQAQKSSSSNFERVVVSLQTLLSVLRHRHRPRWA
jgi:conjugal transfer/entry exclusion protein